MAGFSLHEERAEAIRRGHEGFHFFRYALNSLVAHDQVPGRTNLWGEFQALRGEGAADEAVAAAAAEGDSYASCIGSPADARRHLSGLADAGVDQVIFLQQAGRNRHSDICDSLQLFADAVMPEFKANEAAREEQKAAELAPAIEAALTRKQWMSPMADEDIPVVKASVAQAQTSGTV